MLAKLGDGANSVEQLSQSIESLEAKLAKTTNRGERESIKRDLAGAYRARAGVSRSKADTAAEFADLTKLIEHSPTEDC